MQLIITQDTENKIKIPCGIDNGFDDTHAYRFVFASVSLCCKEYTVELTGTLCGEYAEFYLVENCSGDAGTIKLPFGKYNLSVVDTTDETELYFFDKVLVKPLYNN